MGPDINRFVWLYYALSNLKGKGSEISINLIIWKKWNLKGKMKEKLRKCTIYWK